MSILSLHSDQHCRAHQLIQWGNTLMICGFLVSLCAVVMNYGFERDFSLPLQIAGHIATIVFATIFKIGYVVRCIGAHGLGAVHF